MKKLLTLALISIFLYACLNEKEIDNIEFEANNEKPGTNHGVFVNFETPPDYKGGVFALNEYLAQKIIYPENAVRDSIEGIVFMLFCVEADGKISNASVTKGLHNEIDEACLNAVMQMPEWNPGKMADIPVRMSYTLLVRFSMNRNDKEKYFAIRP